MISDYITQFLNNEFDSDFKERTQMCDKLNNRMVNLNKKLKKQVAKQKENLKRWF